MKTLVIHPKDSTTDFLSPIYEGRGWTVISEDVSRKSLEKSIKEHDRIVMLGHGDKDGMFGHGKYVINSSTMWHLKGKNIVAIWCNADEFVKRHNLKGFYTGMIISEYDEAKMFSLYNATHIEIYESNTLFAKTIAKYIDNTEIAKNVLNEYVDTLDEYENSSNVIINFNKSRIFQR